MTLKTGMPLGFRATRSNFEGHDGCDRSALRVTPPRSEGPKSLRCPTKRPTVIGQILPMNRMPDFGQPRPKPGRQLRAHAGHCEVSVSVQRQTLWVRSENAAERSD
jgi:hypothetical protein